jgi:dimethylargininase
MLIAITRDVSPAINACELTFIERQPIDFQLAVCQQQQYRAALERCGVLVKTLPADDLYPDSCFVEDTAIVVDEIAVMASLGAPSRRGERAAIETELAKYREITRVNLPATIDGGDVLRVGKRLLVGESSRTNSDGIRELARILEPRGYEVSPVRAAGSLHFKSACTALDDEMLLVNMGWVDPADLGGFRLLAVPEGEPMAANVLRIGKRVFVQAGFPAALRTLRDQGYEVEPLDVSEFQKAEAALTCLSIIFERHD